MRTGRLGQSRERGRYRLNMLRVLHSFRNIPTVYQRSLFLLPHENCRAFLGLSLLTRKGTFQ